MRTSQRIFNPGDTVYNVITKQFYILALPNYDKTNRHQVFYYGHDIKGGQFKAIIQDCCISYKDFIRLIKREHRD